MPPRNGPLESLRRLDWGHQRNGRGRVLQAAKKAKRGVGLRVQLPAVEQSLLEEELQRGARIEGPRALQPAQVPVGRKCTRIPWQMWPLTSLTPVEPPQLLVGVDLPWVGLWLNRLHPLASSLLQGAEVWRDIRPLEAHLRTSRHRTGVVLQLRTALHCERCMRARPRILRRWRDRPRNKI